MCGSDSVVECHLAKVKVAGPNPVSRSTHSIGITDKQWHHSQEVRQGSAKSSPPVQVWVMPPKKYLANGEIFFYTKRRDSLHAVKCAECADTRSGFAPKVVAKSDHTVSRSTHSIGITDKQRHHSQEVRQESAKSSPPVQVWVMPPNKVSRNLRDIFFECFLCVERKIAQIAIYNLLAKWYHCRRKSKAGKRYGRQSARGKIKIVCA